MLGILFDAILLFIILAIVDKIEADEFTTVILVALGLGVANFLIVYGLVDKIGSGLTLLAMLLADGVIIAYFMKLELKRAFLVNGIFLTCKFLMAVFWLKMLE